MGAYGVPETVLRYPASPLGMGAPGLPPDIVVDGEFRCSDEEFESLTAWRSPSRSAQCNSGPGSRRPATDDGREARGRSAGRISRTTQPGALLADLIADDEFPCLDEELELLAHL